MLKYFNVQEQDTEYPHQPLTANSVTRVLPSPVLGLYLLVEMLVLKPGTPVSAGVLQNYIQILV